MYTALDDTLQAEQRLMTEADNSNAGRRLKILSNSSGMKFFAAELSESEAVDALSDLKHRIFPRPFERLSPLRGRSDLIGAEIGVCGGEHALSLLRTLSPAKFYCIDPYSLYDGYDEGKSHFGRDQAPLDQTELSAKRLLSPFGDRIVWVKKMSSEAVQDISESLDFVYVDGNHAEKFVTQDIEKYWPLIKRGGVIGGHDFYNGFQSEHDGVVAAVLRFASGRKLKLKVELPDWWIVRD